jgi:hypothetical protein
MVLSPEHVDALSLLGWETATSPQWSARRERRWKRQKKTKGKKTKKPATR